MLGKNPRIPGNLHEFRAEEHTAERVTNSARMSTPRSASRFQCVMISARSAEENTEERATISFVIILLSRFVRPFSSVLNAHAEEHTAERVAAPKSEAPEPKVGNIAGSGSTWQRGITLSKEALLGLHHQVTTMRTASRLRAVHH